MRFSIVIFFILIHNYLFPEYNLYDFYGCNKDLMEQVEKSFKLLSDEERVSQMIIISSGKLSKPKKEIVRLINQNKIGGIIFFNETQKKIESNIKSFNIISESKKTVPLIFSIDGEPTLFNERCLNSPSIKNTNMINSSFECDLIAKEINTVLNNIGIHHNFAPVVDVNLKNDLIKTRSFGSNPDSIIAFSQSFITVSNKMNISTTIKHFPGHGNVVGDSHIEKVISDSINCEFNIFNELIDWGVISVMVGHITINDKNFSSNNYPASLSREIVTNVLRENLNFEGLIITDALNMKAASIYDNAPLLAAKAGNDVLLMPINVDKAISDILLEMEENDDFKNQIYHSVKRILKLKVCLNIIK